MMDRPEKLYVPADTFGGLMSQQLSGFGIGSDAAVGQVLHMSAPLPAPPNSARTNSVEEEKAAVHKASALVSSRLSKQAEQLEGTAQEILEATALMAGDPALMNDIETKIESGKTAERAVFEAMSAYRDKLLDMGGYLAERATDLDDVSQRIRAELQGIQPPGVPTSDSPFILVAKDLSPADTAGLDFSIVQALVTEEGGPTSHTAVLARTNSLPAIVGVKGATQIAEHSTIIVDAGNSTIIVDPSDEQAMEAIERTASRQEALAASTGPGVLSDGTGIQLLANLASVSEIPVAKQQGCEGVGLFRTEFLFLDSPQAPTLDEQVDVYTKLLEGFPGQKVVVRLLDAGADKPLSYLGISDEENPALGVRGYRALRANPQILKTQLRALRQAEQAVAGGDDPAELWVMAPMIADAGEAAEFTKLAKAMGLKQVGVMAEVPSIAVLADQVCAVTDFISVGTNDLAQYTLAADRQLGAVANYQNPWHPAVLRLIKSLGLASAGAQIPLSVCGEASADPVLAVVLVGLGAKSLSMASPALADVRLSLRRVSLPEAQKAAEAACSAVSADEAKAAALKSLNWAN